ncbi:Integrase catalytic domain-containing protein, partial [Aphis craccivora]
DILVYFDSTYVNGTYKSISTEYGTIRLVRRPPIFSPYMWNVYNATKESYGRINNVSEGRGRNVRGLVFLTGAKRPRFRKRIDISNADALSRLPQCRSKRKSTDEVLKEISQYNKVGWPGEKLLNSEYETFYKRREELSLINNCLILGNRVVIPKSLREDVLVLLHKSLCNVRSKMLARSKLVYIPWGNPSDSWKRVHIDFLEINQVKVLIIVDSFSKWIECFAMGSTTATK